MNRYREFIYSGTIENFSSQLETYVDSLWWSFRTPSGPGPRPDIFSRIFPVVENVPEGVPKNKHSFRNIPPDLSKAEFEFYNSGYGGPEGKGIITALSLPDHETRLIVRTTMYFYGPEKEEAVYSIWQGFQKELEKLGLIRELAESEIRLDTLKIKSKKKISKENRIRLLDIIKSSFNDDEIKELCFKLEIKYEELGNNKPLGLIQYCERRRNLKELINLVHKERPRIFDDALILEFGLTGK